MSEFLRCPFCGESSITVADGATFRWRHVECGACGAIGPEIRCQTMGEGTPAEWERQAEADAIAAWNERAIPAELRDLIDCWKANYGLDRYDKVTAARRWAEAGGPADGPIMALATAIEWLEST